MLAIVSTNGADSLMNKMSMGVAWRRVGNSFKRSCKMGDTRPSLLSIPGVFDHGPWHMMISIKQNGIANVIKLIKNDFVAKSIGDHENTAAATKFMAKNTRASVFIVGVLQP